jgi:hypothetical protein
MNKRTEYTLVSAALVAAALVGTAVGLNLHQYPSPAPDVTVMGCTDYDHGHTVPEYTVPGVCVTQDGYLRPLDGTEPTPAPQVVIIDRTSYGAPIQSEVSSPR